MALLLGVGLAGCAGEHGGPADATPTATVEITDSNKGSLFGWVLDEEANPIPGASVAVIERSLETTTTGNGSFALNGLDPGSYSLVAQRLGYESSAVRATVAAGQVTELTLTLRALMVVEARHHTQTAVGFMTCQWSTPALKSRIACNEIGDDEQSVFDFPVDPGLEETLTETIWEQTSALSPEYIELDHFFDGDAKETNVIQRSPHRHHSLDYDDFDEEKEVRESYWLPFGNASQPVIVAFQQRFDVYMTAFYGQSLPEGFTAAEA